jgi:hypothetical protein
MRRSVMAGAVLTVGTMLGVLLQVTAAHAATPVHFQFSMPFSFTDTGTCGFPIVISLQSKFVGTAFFDAQGNFQHLIVEENAVGTDSANGITLRETDHFVDFIDSAGSDKQVGLSQPLEPGTKGVFPLMGESGARVRTIRTTRDVVGRAYGIVTGMAATPDEALAELIRNAEAQAESLDPRTPGEQRAERLRELTQPFEESAPAAQSVSLGPFEVVDLRLTAGVMDGGGNGWLADGTLAQ